MLQPIMNPASRSGTGTAPGHDGIDLFYRFFGRSALTLRGPS